MSEAVEQMLASVGPLNAEQTVLAELAKRLAAMLDAMGPSVAAKMTGQTVGALLRTLDKLGARRGDGIVSTSGRRPPSVADFTASTPPNPQAVHDSGQLARDG